MGSSATLARGERSTTPDPAHRGEGTHRVELSDAEMEAVWQRIAAMRRVYAECASPATWPRERLGRIPGGAQLGFWESDFAAGVLVLDARTAELIACTPQELHDRPGIWETRLHPDDRDGTVKALAAHLKGTTPVYESEYRLWTDSGTWRWILDRGQVVERDAGGLPLRMAGFHCGISPRELDRRSGPHDVRSLTVMAGGVAHTFNNLLMCAEMNTELALWHLPAGSPVGRFLEGIRAAVQRAATLSTQMLTYTGRGTVVTEPVDLSKLVREQVQLLTAPPADHVQVLLDLAPDLPLLSGDAAQLRQLVTNLFVNAVEAVEPETGSVVVRTGVVECNRALLAKLHPGSSLREGPHLLLEVADTGCGMDRETQSRLFDPFFTTKLTGRGLGMAVVLGVVRGHDGAIRVCSQPGHGTTVTVLFPVCPETSPPA